MSLGENSFSESWFQGKEAPIQPPSAGDPPTSLLGEDDAPRWYTPFLGSGRFVSEGRRVYGAKGNSLFKGAFNE